jgi:hypothetical protein
MFASGKTAAVSGGAPDDKFNYVTMLLHGDGTNGAQNNTFVDSSTNNFTITRNGNTTQGSFSPYGSNWSNYFDGSGDYLSTPSSITLGSGDLTIEGWAYPTNTSGGVFYDFRGPDSGSAGNNPVIQWSTVTASKFTVRIDGTNAITSSSTFSTNTWHHVALVRSGTTVTLYVNGTSQGTYTTSTSFAQAYVRIGAYGGDGSVAFTGYASNLRAVIGTAIYTTTFTPPTTPLTAVSGTALLTCQSNRFVDNSSNAYTITSTGNTSVQRFNPFGTSTAYSTSVIGGSGYFDGSGDYLSVANNSNLNLGSGDYTLECWIYPTSANGIIWSQWNNGGDNSGYLYLNGTNFQYRIGGTTYSFGSFKTNNWTHVAVSRSGSSVYLFVNGELISTQTNSTNITTTGATVIGANDTGSTPANIFNGYIAGLRQVKGAAVYTSAFTPPTSPPTAITNTQLLTNFTNGAIFDNAMMNNLETVGNAQISTSVKKYGTGSLAFDGTGDYLKTQYSPNTQLGSGNFTIEFWIYFNSVASGQEPMSGYDNTNLNWGFYLLSSGTLNYYLSSDGSSWNIASGVSVGSVSTGQWYHVALVRNGSTFTPYLNGVAGTTATSSSAIYSNSQGVYIGGLPSGYYFNGYIDDLRITKGYARYTANFTAPTAAFPDIGPT